MSLSGILDEKIAVIKKSFDVQKILAIKCDSEYVKGYYRVNKIPYSIFHTSTDLIYMGISRDGIYKEDDLLEAARIIEKYIRKLSAKRVLELATGRGANAFYLANRNSDIEFDGIDISDAQLTFAKRKAKNINNYSPQRGDFHDLSRFPDSSFDLVFVVEALCYSRNKELALKEVARILRQNGMFIIFDGYREKSDSQLTETEKVASKLTEKSMAVDKFESYSDFKKKVRESKMKMEDEKNLSEFILPTMDKFEKLSSKFLQLPFIVKKIAILLLPEKFTLNTIAGYLMPTLVRLGVSSYRLIVIRKD